MQRKFIIAACAVVVCGLNGCEGHQAKVDARQKEYDQLAKQFHQDCSAEYLTIPPTESQKCNEEDKKVKEAWQRLRAEQVKQ